MLYNQVQLVVKPQKVANPFTRSLKVVYGKLPQAVARPAWGIDPGVNFGLTVIEGYKIYVFYGALMQDDKPGRYGLIAFKFLQSIMETFNLWSARMVIEGAAYGATFRQVELSEIRTGFYLAAALSPGFSDVIIKPPKTIRKAVFNNGTIHAADEFPLLNHNAADSLAVALFAATL